MVLSNGTNASKEVSNKYHLDVIYHLHHWDIANDLEREELNAYVSLLHIEKEYTSTNIYQWDTEEQRCSYQQSQAGVRSVKYDLLNYGVYAAANEV